MCCHACRRALLVGFRRRSPNLRAGVFATALAATAAVLFAAAPCARADWVFSGGVIYDYHDGGNGGYDEGSGPVGQTALYGATANADFTFSRQDGMDAATAAPYIFDDEHGPAAPPVDFLSVPGGSGDNSYLVIGFTGKLIVPQGIGNYDLLISEFYGGAYTDYGNETAKLYVSVFDPAHPYDYNFQPVDQGIYVGGTSYNTLLADTDNYVDLAFAGFAGQQISAIKIEGLDASGSSFGYDVMSVLAWDGALQSGGPGVPEPASMVLLGAGGLGLLCLRRRKRR